MSMWRAAGVFVTSGSLLMMAACNGNGGKRATPTATATQVVVAPTATATQVPPPPPTPTATVAPPHTATPTEVVVPPTPTATETEVVGPTATPTPAPECGNDIVEAGEQCEADADCDQGQTCVDCQCTGGAALGERLFSIVKNPANGKTTFVASVIGIDVSGANWQGQLRLVAGAPDAEGVASLSLAEDAAFQFDVPLGGQTVCFRILAEGSHGFIDCDGGSAADADVTLNSNGLDPGDAPVWQNGLGDPAGPGTAVLIAQAGTTNIGDPAATPEDCAAAAIDLQEMTFTTTTVTGTIENTRQGAPVSLSGSGEPFDCDTFTTEDGPGAFATAIVAEDAPIVFQDVASLLAFGDN